MRSFTIAVEAANDIAQIERTSLDGWGIEGRKRYRALIDAAIAILREIPDPPGSRALSGNEGLRRYHLRSVRGSGVRQPRHIMLYRVSPDAIELLRVMHESRDLGAVLREVPAR